MLHGICSLAAASLTLIAPGASGAVQDTAPAPRLVVVLCVDSLYHGQLERLDPWWTGGFRQLLDRGTVFPEAALPYGKTEGAPGAASFGTGCLPSSHGITRDAHVDDETGLQSSCIADPKARTLSSTDAQMSRGQSASAHGLRRGGWAAVLRERWPGSRSVAIAGKATTAVLLAGRSPDLALWWDSYGRGFVSSTAYGEELPDWVDSWNGGWTASARTWSWESTVPAERQLTATAADDRPGEHSIGGAPTTLPHPAPELPEELSLRERAFLAGRAFTTPLMDSLVLDLARRAVIEGGLGADDEVDLLALGLDAGDLLGQSHGPHSVEVTDTLLRIDAELGELIAFLDEKVGAGRWILVLGSDHGLPELPEGDRRFSPGGVRLLVRARRQAIATLRERLLEAFGTDFAVNLTGPADGLVFGRRDFADWDTTAAEARRVAAEAMARLDWVARTFTRDELLAEAREDDSPWLRLARRSAHERGGVDVEVQLAHRHLMGIAEGTRAGSAYLHDRRQVLAFLGPGFRVERRAGAASVVDALPTLLARLGVEVPADVDGRDLLGP